MLDWNQIFIDTLIATNTANSSSQRLGAIVHTAIFDAYNGIEQRYTPIFVHTRAPTARRAERRSSLRRTRRWSACSRPRQPALDARYAASLAALSDDCEQGGQSIGRGARARARIERGVAWGTEVAHAVLGLARDRWFQRELPSVHRRDRGRPVAAHAAGVRTDERPGVGIHRRCSSWPAIPSSSLDRREV